MLSLEGPHVGGGSQDFQIEVYFSTPEAPDPDQTKLTYRVPEKFPGVPRQPWDPWTSSTPSGVPSCLGLQQGCSSRGRGSAALLVPAEWPQADSGMPDSGGQDP